ncbi:MAG: ATP-dependent DNA ligase [Thermoplasmatota archaeon]
MRFSQLASFFRRLEEVSGRLEMTTILVELLGEVPVGEMVAVVRLLQGSVAPDWEGLELGLAEKQILKVLAGVAGRPVVEVETRYHEVGDLGLTAEAILSHHASRQASLVERTSLTVPGLFSQLTAIAHMGGSGSQAAKQAALTQLLVASEPLEGRYIIRMVAGRLRLGVADMTVLDALAAWHLGRGVKSVQDMEEGDRQEQVALRRELERSYDLCSDLAVVAHALAAGGPKAVAKLGIRPGVPVRPMAAERAATLGEIFTRMQGEVGMEYKYDGLRLQAHIPRSGSPIRFFSRRLEEVTPQYPDVARALEAHFRGRGCIVEGEAVAIDADGHLRPFQDVSRRRGRKADVEEVATEIPITLFLFDILADGDENVMGESHLERRQRLEALCPKDGPIRLSKLKVAKDVEGMELFFDEALEEGAEGIMCKDPRAPYKAGARGFAWIKFKADYDESLVDTLDLVAIGAFYGRGRRAGWYGALLMAAYDPEAGRWESVCKLGTGFSDEVLKGLKGRFSALVSQERPAAVDGGLEPDVWFRPEIVMEVQAAELSLSPVHRAGWGRFREGAGLAARFPRFTGRFRDDKGPREATTVAELAGIYSLRREGDR